MAVNFRIARGIGASVPWYIGLPIAMVVVMLQLTWLLVVAAAQILPPLMAVAIVGIGALQRRLQARRGIDLPVDCTDDGPPDSIYLRKVLNAGPYQFQMTSDGIQQSSRMFGFRRAAGPVANYVLVDTAGVSYSAEFEDAPSAGPTGTSTTRTVVGLSDGQAMFGTTGHAVRNMVPTRNDHVIVQLNESARRARVALILAIVLAVLTLLTLPFGLLLLVLMPVVGWYGLRDMARRNVVLFYEVAGTRRAWYEQLLRGVGDLQSSQGKWRVTASTDLITDSHIRKRNGMATHSINRKKLTVQFDAPKFLVTNVKVPTFSAGRDAIYFLPDRVLVRSGARFTDIAYHHLVLGLTAGQFNESLAVPADGIRVGTTWQYANVRGGQDKRFGNNREIPVMSYGRWLLQTESGLAWDIMFSRPGAGDTLNQAAKSVPQLPVIPLDPARIPGEDVLVITKGTDSPSVTASATPGDRRGGSPPVSEIPSPRAGSEAGTIVPEARPAQLDTPLVAEPKPDVGKPSEPRDWPVRRSSNSDATKSLITGLLSLPLIVTLVGSLVLGLLAIRFGRRGKSASAGGGAGFNRATIGLALGWIAVASTAILITLAAIGAAAKLLS